MNKQTIYRLITSLVAIVILSISLTSQAHHVLGRPSYSLSEDSTTPPAMEIESQIEHFYVSAMAFPAFPSPNEHGRINVHISDMNNSKPYDGEVVFKVRNDSFVDNDETLLGTQAIDDNVYRQSFVFEKAGKYIISAQFEDQGHPYIIDIPLQVGGSRMISTSSLIIIIVALAIFSFGVFKRRQLRRLKIKQHHEKVSD